jgi:hypothetical protein
MLRVTFGNLDAAERIQKKLHHALLQSAQDLGDHAAEGARARIRSRGAVASHQLESGFTVRTVGGPGEYMTVVENHTEYAPYVNNGVRGIESGIGEHQYTTKRPPLAPLAEWAELKLGGYTVDWNQNRLVPTEVKI